MSDLNRIEKVNDAMIKINDFLNKGIPFQIIEDDVMNTPQIKIWLAYCDKKELCEELIEFIESLQLSVPDDVRREELLKGVKS